VISPPVDRAFGHSVRLICGAPDTPGTLSKGQNTIESGNGARVRFSVGGGEANGVMTHITMRMVM